MLTSSGLSTVAGYAGNVMVISMKKEKAVPAKQAKLGKKTWDWKDFEWSHENCYYAGENFD